MEAPAPAPGDAAAAAATRLHEYDDAASVTLPVNDDATLPGEGEGWPANEAKPLPAGWAEHMDDASQHAYYHHEALNLTQWEVPTEQTAYATQEDEDQSRAVEAPEDSSIESWEAAPASPKLRKPKPRKQNKDYVQLADAYKLEAQYRKLDGHPTCVMCHRNPVHDVLFPCEHKCVCRGCLRENGIGESREEGKWPLCPLCCGEIKRILPHDGREVERYWSWVLEVEPRLPPKFAQRFEFAGAYLRQTDDPEASCACTVS